MELYNPKALSEKEFELLAGSSAMVSMIKNRFTFRFKDTQSYNEVLEVQRKIDQWLAQNCNSLYYTSYTGWYKGIYIAEKKDAVLFKLFWEKIIS